MNLLIEVAKMAERAYLFEIEGKTKPLYSFIKPSYWDGFRKGLLAPEKILLDLRQMEKAYLENDKHRIEITRPILLFENLDNPVYNGSDFPDGQHIEVAKESNTFKYHIVVSENLFKNDFANHQNRFVRDIRLQVISNNTVESYKCLNAELSISNSVFNAVVATSMALQDAGKFDFKFVDENYSPFDGTSIDSSGFEMDLKLTGLENITDKTNAKVVVFVSYTATRSSDVQST